MCKKRQELFGIGGSSLTSKTVVPQGLPRVCVHRSRGLSEPIHVEVLDAANAERVEPQSCRCAGHRARPKPKPHRRVRRRKGRIDVRSRLRARRQPPSGPAAVLDADARVVAVGHVVTRAMALRRFFSSLAVISWVEMHMQVVMLLRVTADPAVLRHQFGHLSTFLRIARTL